MSDAPDPTAKSYTLEQVKEALPALMAAGPDVMPSEKRSRLLMGALAALALAADKGSGGGLTAEIVADVELMGQVCGEVARTFRATAPAAEPAAAPAVESRQTAGGHALTTIAAGKAEGLSDNDLRDAIRAALAEKFPPEENEGDSPWHVWIIDVFRDDSTVVYELRSEKFQLGYTYGAGAVTLTGEPVEVRVSYEPVGQETAEAEPGAEMTPEPSETEQSAGGAAAKTAKSTTPPAVVIPLNLSEAYRQRKEAAAAAASR